MENGSLRCTVCGATFDTLDNKSCPKCGTDEDYIVLNEYDDEVDNEED